MQPLTPSGGHNDLCRPRLDQMIDMGHELVRLGRVIDWPLLQTELRDVYTDTPAQRPLSTRLMAGLAIIRHVYILSDEELVARWVENPYFQHFCGEEHFRHRAPFDRSAMTRWRRWMGDARLEVLLEDSHLIAVNTDAVVFGTAHSDARENGFSSSSVPEPQRTPRRMNFLRLLRQEPWR
jgi:transposase, IS5 family